MSLLYPKSSKLVFELELSRAQRLEKWFFYPLGRAEVVLKLIKLLPLAKVVLFEIQLSTT